MENKKRYFVSSATDKRVIKDITDRAACIITGVLDREKSPAKRLIWAAALYAAVEAAEMAVPSLMAAGRQLHEEIKEAEK